MRDSGLKHFQGVELVVVGQRGIMSFMVEWLDLIDGKVLLSWKPINFFKWNLCFQLEGKATLTKHGIFFWTNLKIMNVLYSI